LAIPAILAILAIFPRLRASVVKIAFPITAIVIIPPLPPFLCVSKIFVFPILVYPW
jgi:hypothetical protein